ncbi:MAG: ABC transporter permease [Pseudomonadota bacterium]
MPRIVLPFSSRLALRQLRYKGGNLLGVFSGVCVAIILVFVQIGYEQAVVNSVLNFDRALRGDLVVVGPQYEVIGYAPPWFSRGVLAKAEGVPGVADARPVYISVVQVRSWINEEPLTARFTGFDPARPVFDLPEVDRQLPLLALPGTVLIDRESRQGLSEFAASVDSDGMRPLYLQSAAVDTAPRVDVRGTYSLGPDFTIFGNFITSDLTFYRLFRQPLDRVSLGLLTVQPGYEVDDVKAAVTRSIGSDAKVYTHAEFLTKEHDFFIFRTPVGIVFMSGIGIGIVIGVVFVLNMLHGIIDSNLSEYAVLRAMGYRDRFFRSLVLQIAALITSVALVPSLIITALIYAALRQSTQLPFELTWPQGLTVFAASVMMGMAAALLAIRKLRTSNPLDLFS